MIIETAVAIPVIIAAVLVLALVAGLVAFFARRNAQKNRVYNQIEPDDIRSGRRFDLGQEYRHQPNNQPKPTHHASYQAVPGAGVPVAGNKDASSYVADSASNNNSAGHQTSAAVVSNSKVC